MTNLVLRAATAADAEAIHALVAAHLDEGHLLPRQLPELRTHADRFVVGDIGGQLIACAELAPLSSVVAEVRSLVVAHEFRSRGLATRLVNELRNCAQTLGFSTLTAFTHDTRFFGRQGFSPVPHARVREKIMTDCVSCPLFRHCDQYAMVLPLQELGGTPRAKDPPRRVGPRVSRINIRRPMGAGHRRPQQRVVGRGPERTNR